jgi:hypothetical protein
MKSIFTAALLAGTIATFGIANAMPLAPASGVNADVIQVAGSCGRGYHPGPRGVCIADRRGPAIDRREHRRDNRMEHRRCRHWGPDRRACRTWW